MVLCGGDRGRICRASVTTSCAARSMPLVSRSGASGARNMASSARKKAPSPPPLLPLRRPPPPRLRPDEFTFHVSRFTHLTYLTHLTFLTKSHVPPPPSSQKPDPQGDRKSTRLNSSH